MINLTRRESLGICNTIAATIDYKNTEDMHDCINLLKDILKIKLEENTNIRLLKVGDL